MTDLQAIAVRSSRRAYNGELGEDEVRKLEAVVARENLAAGLSCALVLDGAAAFAGIRNSYGLFSGVRSMVVLAGPKADPHLQEKAGHSGQRIVLEAVKLGLGTCWVGGTYNQAEVAGHLPAGQQLVAVVTVGPVKAGKGFFEKTVSRVASGRRKSGADLSVIEGEAPTWFTEGVNAAAKAPSALNHQPVRFTWKDGAASATVPGGGLELVDLGIAKLHFELAAGGAFKLGNGEAFTKTESGG